MSKYRQWILTLGIAAATPGIALSGPFSFLNMGRAPQTTAARPTQSVAPGADNQQVAEAIAGALRQANLNGYEIEIEYKNGIARLTGMIADVRQKAKATQVIRRVPGVQSVDNQLELIDKPQFRPPQGAGLSQTPGQGNPFAQQDAMQLAGNSQPTGNWAPTSSGSIQNNQKVAQAIANAVSDAGLNGYDIEIRHQNGTTLLTGSVTSDAEKMIATNIVRGVPGVQRVENRLQVTGEAAQAASAPQQPEISQVSQAQMAQAQAAQAQMAHAQMAQARMAQAQMAQAAYQQQGRPTPQQLAMLPAAAAGAPAAAAYQAMGGEMPPGAGPQALMGAAENPVYNSPNLPDYAWPAYADYPNYAAVTYPKQYSASAWPYIGPFYPYPQIPLGWRKAQLEWDDGYWNLNFNPRTDKWWWFVNPENWH